MQLRLSPKSTRVLVTALDIIIIAAVSTTVVMLLGARGRFSIGSTIVTVHNPLRPLLLAALVAATRRLLGRGQPVLPSLNRSSIAVILEAERELITNPPPATGAAKYYALAAMVASLVWLTPHLVNIRHVPDAGDPLFSAWRLARFSHQLLNQPSQLFDGNIYHPTRYTLTYSDPTVLEAFAALPFLAAGADPLVVSNVVFLASFPLSALAFFFSAWRLTGDAQAGCIAGMLGGLSAFKLEHYSHLELQFFFFAPLALLWLLRMVAAPSWRTGAWFGALITAQWLACMYFGVMVFLFLAPAGVLAAVAWRLRPTRRLAEALVAAASIIVVGCSLTVVPFLRSQSERGGRSMAEARWFSATPGNYGARHRYLATYYNTGDRSKNQAERQLFPGSVPLILAAGGVLPPMSLGTVGLAAGTALVFEASLGGNGLIYDELYAYLLPFRGLRVPARFAALVGTGLFLLSAYGTRRILRLARSRNRRAAVFVALAAAALIDLRSAVPLQPYPDTIPPIYGAVTKDMVLMELPTHDLAAGFSYMYFSTFHWARLINGDSGHYPRWYSSLTEDLIAFPNADLLQRLRDLGTTHVTVNCRLFERPWRCPTLLEKMDATPELEVISRGIWDGAEVRLYRIRK